MKNFVDESREYYYRSGRAGERRKIPSGRTIIGRRSSHLLNGFMSRGREIMRRP
jgi:hypothetical protein